MNVYDILTEIGYCNLRDFGKEWRTCPLYRASDNHTSLSIKKDTGEWYDFSERSGGSLPQLIQKTLNLTSQQEALAIIGNRQTSKLTNKYELTDVQKFDKQLLIKLVKDNSYWNSRKISDRTLKIFQGGITFNGRMAYRYVFPIFDIKNELVGFSGRSLNDNPDFPKWKHIGNKSHWLYPFIWNKEFIEAKSIILLESIGDMLTLWEHGIKNTLVTFGIDISSKIIELLLKLDIPKIFISFNNDANNHLVGNKAATEGKQKLIRFFDEKQITIAIPNEKDFGEMTGEQISIWKNQYQIQN